MGRSSPILISQRRVFRLGKSLVLTLPAEWVERVRLKPGMVVVFIGDKAAKIVLPPDETV